MKRFFFACTLFFLLFASCKSTQKQSLSEPEDLSSWTAAGIFSVYMNASKLFAKKGVLIQNPAGDLKGFMTGGENGDYAVFFKDAERKAFSQAVKEYSAAFEKKALKASGKSTAAYGKISGLESLSEKDGKSSACPADFSLGFTFIKKNPYFVISISRSKDGALKSGSAPKACYLTKPQAQKLSEFFLDDGKN